MKFYQYIKYSINRLFLYITDLLGFSNKVTDIKRWEKLTNLSEDWDARTKIVASMIPLNSSVIEFGAGRLTLPVYLKEGCSYQPVDVVSRSPDTIVFDLNTLNYPALSTVYNYAVFSGVFEYVLDIPRLFIWLTSVSNNVIFSYAVTDYQRDQRNRRNNGWVNDYSEIEIDAILKSHKFTCIEKRRWNNQIIWYCHFSNQ